MSNFVVIFVCLAAGLAYRSSRYFGDFAPKALNGFVVCVSLPALILTQVPPLLRDSEFTPAWLVPISMAWILFLASWAFFAWLGARLGWSRAKTGALVLTAGLGNTSFVGFPMLEALMGRDAVRFGILVDQPGSFLVLSTLGLSVGALYSGARVTAGLVAKRVISFPPFVALLLAVAWTLVGNPGAEYLALPLERIAATLVPVALFAVGLQLRADPAVLRRRWLPLTTGLGFKLALAPLALAGIYLGVFGQRGPMVHATLLEAAMAPMITAAVVASEFELDSQIANLMVGIGIPLSLITVPLWDFFLRHYLLSS